MTDQQLELGFGETRAVAQLSQRERRISRSAWWFAHMRRIVDRAMDWNAEGKLHPEQTWLPGVQRQVRA